MHHRSRPIWDLPESLHTSESVYRQRSLARRAFLAAVGRSAAGIVGTTGLLSAVGCMPAPTPEEVESGGAVAPLEAGQSQL